MNRVTGMSDAFTFNESFTYCFLCALILCGYWKVFVGLMYDLMSNLPDS